MNTCHSFFGLLIIATFASGCQQAESPAPAPVSQEAGAQPQTQRTAGSITIDEQTWTLVPDIQCSVYPGPVVSIAGHAAEDEAVEIVIDYNGTEGPTGVSVTKPGGTLEWNAYASMNFQIERKRVQGAGYFTGSTHGATRQAEGRFDVDCK